MKRRNLNELAYRGCREIEFVSNGMQSDPSLFYKGYEFNYYDIEDALWDMFCEDMGYDDSASNDYIVEKEFDDYVCEVGPSYLEDVIYGGYFEGDSKSWKTESNHLTELFGKKKSDDKVSKTGNKQKDSQLLKNLSSLADQVDNYILNVVGVVKGYIDSDDKVTEAETKLLNKLNKASDTYTGELRDICAALTESVNRRRK